jgi:hypothetical protein
MHHKNSWTFSGIQRADAIQLENVAILGSYSMFFVCESILFDNLLNVMLSVIDSNNSIELLFGIHIQEVHDLVEGICKVKTLNK